MVGMQAIEAAKSKEAFALWAVGKEHCTSAHSDMGVRAP